tara:strand:+ start:5988 stop:6290 length:303 start_codon:yes stop_codon:yes gene_type:complete
LLKAIAALDLISAFTIFVIVLLSESILLFVKVCVPVMVAIPISITPVFVATPSRYISLYPLSVVEKVTVAPEPDTAFNCNVSAPVVPFLIVKSFCKKRKC